MKRSTEPPFALRLGIGKDSASPLGVALPHSLVAHGVAFFSEAERIPLPHSPRQPEAERIPLPHWVWRFPTLRRAAALVG